MATIIFTSYKIHQSYLIKCSFMWYIYIVYRINLGSKVITSALWLRYLKNEYFDFHKFFSECCLDTSLWLVWIWFWDSHGFRRYMAEFDGIRKDLFQKCYIHLTNSIPHLPDVFIFLQKSLPWFKWMKLNGANGEVWGFPHRVCT